MVPWVKMYAAPRVVGMVGNMGVSEMDADFVCCHCMNSSGRICSCRL
jgi:hypothetical protein